MSEYTNNTPETLALLRELLPQGAPPMSDAVLGFYLGSAEEAVLKKAFQVGTPSEEQREVVLQKYLHIQLRIALALIAKQGIWGETGHSELGISRSYDSADVPKSLLDQITPYAKTYFAQ